MPTPTKGPRLGGSPSHERMIIANLARSLFAEGRIRTTEAKAKRLRPQAERLITFAKRGDLASRRHVLTVVRDKAVVHKLFAEVAPRFADRPGGYTRILRLGPRPGDAAPMVLIELVEQGEVVQRGDGDEGEAEAGGREDEDLAPNVPTDAEIEAGAAPLETDEDEDVAEEDSEDELQLEPEEAPAAEGDVDAEAATAEAGAEETDGAAAEGDTDADAEAGDAEDDDGDGGANGGKRER